MPCGGYFLKRRCFVKTLMIGLGVAIVYLATYFVSAMERAW
jgi:hypothetical protein